MESGSTQFGNSSDDIHKFTGKVGIGITSPLDTTVTSFLSDFGGYNPDQMASFVSMLSNDDKGLKQMTSIPIKTWMPASVIMALLIGGSIAMIVLLNNAGSFTDAFSGMMPNP